jgi:hypothetical protein
MKVTSDRVAWFKKKPMVPKLPQPPGGPGRNTFCQKDLPIEILERPLFIPPAGIKFNGLEWDLDGQALERAADNQTKGGRAPGDDSRPGPLPALEVRPLRARLWPVAPLRQH